jgi:hypothetical protein
MEWAKFSQTSHLQATINTRFRPVLFGHSSAAPQGSLPPGKVRPGGASSHHAERPALVGMCARVPGGTGHRPILTDDPPVSRTHRACTQLGTQFARSSRRHVAAGNGQVGRSTRTLARHQQVLLVLCRSPSRRCFLPPPGGVMAIQWERAQAGRAVLRDAGRHGEDWAAWWSSWAERRPSPSWSC